MIKRVGLLAIGLSIVALLPAVTSGEVVRLRDGSTLRGRLVRVAGDSLTFRLNIGTPIVLLRPQVLSIAFDDSVAAAVIAAPAVPAGTTAAAATGKGRITVSFKDRELSSKISIDKKKQWDEHVLSNHIVVEFLVDGKALYTAEDSTMDKTIYKGHIQQLKNDIKLQDFTVEAPSGMHQVELVVRNRDSDTFRYDFDPEPLNVVLVLDDFDVRAGGAVRIDVGINRGTISLGRPKFYRLE